MPKKYKNCSGYSCSNSFNVTSESCNSDFTIKQGDTCPLFKINIKDPETGLPVSYEDWEVTTFMFFESCLRSIDSAHDGISGCSGFSGYMSEEFAGIKLLGKKSLCQVKIGDIIEVDDCNQNRQEFMLVIDIDYDCDTILVQRGYGGSDIYSHRRGDKLIFYRIYGKTGFIDSVNEEDLEEGIELDNSVIGYNWAEEDTSHRGCYFFEFKLMKNAIGISGISGYSGSVDIQLRSFPLNTKGYKISIV